LFGSEILSGSMGFRLVWPNVPDPGLQHLRGYVLYIFMMKLGKNPHL